LVGRPVKIGRQRDVRHVQLPLREPDDGAPDFLLIDRVEAQLVARETVFRVGGELVRLGIGPVPCRESRLLPMLAHEAIGAQLIDALAARGLGRRILVDIDGPAIPAVTA
jgi:hypothetical protein